MDHHIRVTLNNGRTVVIAVKKSARLIRGIVDGIQEILQMLRKSITKMVDTYCWSKAEYLIGEFVAGTVTPI